MYSETVHAMYLDYFNNYLTVEKFAEHNLLSVEHAKQLPSSYGCLCHALEMQPVELSTELSTSITLICG